MRAFFKGKTGVILLGILGLAALAVLASGLRDVSFRPGLIIKEGEASSISLPVARLVENMSGIPLWKQLMAWGIVFLIVLLISTILSPELRRRVVRTFIRFTLILIGLYYLAHNFSYLFTGLGIFRTASTLTRVTPDPDEGIPPPVFEPPHVSPALSFLIGILIAVALVALFWSVQRWWKRRQAFLALMHTPEDLADIARHSLDQLSRGGAWDDVIVESYVRMSEAVAKRRGLRRDHNVTPSEFAAYLEKAGVPGDAVRTLTRLFESVRYGARRTTTDENEQAVNCLTAILNFCGEPQ